MSKRTKFWSKVYMNWKDIMPKPGWLPHGGVMEECGTTGSHLRHQRLEASSHWHMGQHIIKHHRRNCWPMEKVVKCMIESKGTSLWTFAKLKRLFSDPPPYTIDSFQSHQQSTQGSCTGLEFRTSLEKSLNFRKLKKVFELFWKKSGRRWIVWNLSIWLCRFPVIVALKLVQELLRLFY